MIFRSIFFLVSTCLLLLSATAQVGYSSAAMGMSQHKSPYQLIPSPDEVVEEEYFNYHLHQLPRPAADRTIHLDAQSLPLDGNRHLLQVGVSTRNLTEMTTRQRVNVSLVIDCSGSMAHEDRIGKSKAAILTFIDQLEPEDHVSLVAFESQARVLLPAQAIGNGAAVRLAVEQLLAGGSTALEAGIRLGYETLLPAVRPGFDNRMIILTDAIANTGIIDPNAIVERHDGFRSEVELSFSLIGVGVDFNYELSRTITANGRDQVHFISKPEHIEKIFVREVEALLYPIARQPRLHLTLPQGVTLERIYGYAPRVNGQQISLNLRDFNAGLTQVVLLEVRGSQRDLRQFSALLTYREPAQGPVGNLRADLRPADQDNDLSKNHLIAQMAASLEEMAVAYHTGQKSRAQQTLVDQLQAADRQPDLLVDNDVRRMCEILANYRNGLGELVGR
ncbi:MAG: VWA domain-containing protein [Bacteroidota bacterium]